MVMLGWSVHLTTLFPWASLTKRLTVIYAHTFAGIKLATPGSAVRHVTDCTMRPSIEIHEHAVRTGDKYNSHYLFHLLLRLEQHCLSVCLTFNQHLRSHGDGSTA